MTPIPEKAEEILNTLYSYIQKTGYSVHFHKESWGEITFAVTEVDPIDGRGTRGVTHHHIEGRDKFISHLHRVVNKLGD